MVKWSPWPPAVRRFEVKVELLRLEGIGGGELKGKTVAVEMAWKGPRAGLAVALRRREKRRSISAVRAFGDESWLDFGDSSGNVCGFSISTKANLFNAWDISFLFHECAGSKPLVAGSVSVNLGEISSQAAVFESEEKQGRMIQKNLPISLEFDGVSIDASLLISVSFLEIQTTLNSSVTFEEADLADKEDGFLRRMSNYVSKSRRNGKKIMEQSEESDCIQACSRLTDGTYDSSTSGAEDSSGDLHASSEPERLGYGSIASAAGIALSEIEDESGVCSSSSNQYEERSSIAWSESLQHYERGLASPSKGGFLSWKKRRLSFRGGKKKQEPLLKKENEDGGGDDIDYARRQLCSTEVLESSTKNAADELAERPAPDSEFGTDDFIVGSWEEKELISRNGDTKLKANMFFASIDQRSESAAGESACTALVAVIADWLQANPGAMPTKSEFDGLIREGSMEWRKLCENSSYQERFPDGHFDLDTVLEEAGIRPLSLAHEKSFVGFFHPEIFEFFRSAMSFDDIWNQISIAACDFQGQVYIVSWNDHFFVLKADADAYYIIDTLGERLFEGCDRAYILRFDNSTSMHRVQEKAAGEGENDGEGINGMQMKGMEDNVGVGGVEQNGNQVLCSGRDCCKEFIKRFFAAVPLEQLEMDLKKGKVCGLPLHQRLQIEFLLTTPTSSSSRSACASPSRATSRMNHRVISQSHS